MLSVAASQIQAWDCCPAGDQKIPKVNRASYQKASFPEACERDCTGLQNRFVPPASTAPSASQQATHLSGYTNLVSADLRFQSSAVLALQEAAEAYLVSLFEGRLCLFVLACLSAEQLMR